MHGATRSITTIAVACAVLTGCTPVISGCPDIGWRNEVLIDIASGGAVQTLRVCTSRECADTVSPADSPADFSTTERLDPDSWSTLIDMATPDQIWIRAFAADDTMLIETEAELTWQRVGGSEECGGPERAAVSLLL